MTSAEQKLLASLTSTRKTSSLTPEQHRALIVRQLEKSKRSTLTDFQLGKITNWQDYINLSGMPIPAGISDDTTPVSYKLIRDTFDNYISTVASGSLNLAVAAQPTGTLNTLTSVRAEPDIDSIPDRNPREPEDEFSKIDCLRNNPAVVYNKHQERAAAGLVRNLMLRRYRGQGLSCRVGGGKTFILAAAIRELYERSWPPLMDSVAMYPLVFVTKASIVEQTERVLYKKFGLREGHQVDVTNIEQFRCKFGEHFVRKDIVLVDGVEQVVYKWNKFAAPALIIIDESQGVKNIDSEQSKIFQAYNDLEGDYYTIHSSATLFTRVIESKVLAVATRLEW